MKILCFSSFTFSYLDRARVLFQTVRRHHPDWRLVALITDRPPAGVELVLADEPFDSVTWFEDLGLPGGYGWLFQHDIIEACTAVKGPFIHQACQAAEFDAVVYLDPDTALLAPLETVTEGLEQHDGLLTPHLLDPEVDLRAVWDNEVSALRTGIFNLGFVAVRTRGDGARFAAWWNDRLLALCHDDVPAGLFVDQRWCDHAPVFFPNLHVLRDPGCNVASWNLSRRDVAIGRDGVITVNGAPLRFWHFTKFGPVGDGMTRRYAGDNHAVHEVWAWYRRRMETVRDPRIPDKYWAYGQYADGAPIPKADRLLYRDDPALRARYPDPFSSGPDSFQTYAAALRLTGGEAPA